MKKSYPHPAPGRRLRAAVAGAALGFACLLPGSAHALFTVDFSEDGNGNALVHGEILDNDYTLANGGIVDGNSGESVGMTIGVDNNGGGPDLAVVFDSTTLASNTSDDDLLAPFTDSNGNPHSNQQLANPGNLLIVQENTTGCGDDICDDPDDEAGGPNSFTFSFTEGVTLFSLDVFDVDGTPDQQMETVEIELTTGSNVMHTFTNLGTGGNNTSDRVFFDNGIFDVVSLVATFSSSGALSNLRGSIPGDPTDVPEPATGLILGLGLLGVAARRRRLF